MKKVAERCSRPRVVLASAVDGEDQFFIILAGMPEVGANIIGRDVVQRCDERGGVVGFDLCLFHNQKIL